jgi:hypothetical protein|tara:strand:+ start:278 stop:535 length:258 start_codon:yes stop_codon:yes gene_type:complete
MRKTNIDLVLKIILCVGLFIFLILINYLPKHECNKCEFKLNDKTLNTGEVINEYFSRCIDPYVGEGNYHHLDLPIGNLTNNESVG